MCTRRWIEQAEGLQTLRRVAAPVDRYHGAGGESQVGGAGKHRTSDFLGLRQSTHWRTCACSSRQPASMALTTSVSARPGETETTRMRGASARVSDRVILSTAAFDAQKATLLPIAVTAAMDDRFTTSAWSLWSRRRRKARTTAKGPRTLEANISSNKASSSRSSSPRGTKHETGM
jgi:hypothetical protein